ncbi:UV DNA damage endonuclease [Clostridium sp. N3C]|uniref:UV DNA damage repair endonuclease UvsE n=1 Tax=Clostridium sp. N3C TaxID=1776758 RepID=UPI00092DEDC5|nr:UV DNA damage repair endonuclease UvsE [Clostridium sp. N3C]SCN24938.1 UV DNA damage endonuclease [Clostridium sp. N3C]
MRVRLGYVAIALNLPKTTSSSNVTYTLFKKLPTEEKQLEKLKTTTLNNLNNLYKILNYNAEQKIHFYRITSTLVPLATHPEVDNWNYRLIFKKDFERLGNFIKENNLRVDTHPNEFNVINSSKATVVYNSINNLKFHVNLFEDMNYPLGKMVLHVGSGEGGKDIALNRFISNFENVPSEISSRLILENDDKTFTAAETLDLCKRLNLPMVLDVHHHNCNNNGEVLEDLLEEILATWDKEQLPPKFHFSSPKEGPLDRKHSDFIVAEDFITFIEICKVYDRDIDIMLEAKQKDLALFKLMEDLKRLRKNWNYIDNSTFEIL